MFFSEFSELELRGASNKDDRLTLKIRVIVFAFLLSYIAYRVLSRSMDWTVEYINNKVR